MRFHINGNDECSIGLGSLLNFRELSDVEFVFDCGAKLYGNRCLLASWSQHFRELFFGSGALMGNTASVPICDTPHDAFLAFLTLCYKGTLESDDAILLVELHRLFDRFLMINMMEKVAHVLRSSMTTDALLATVDAAHRAGQMTLRDHLVDRICSSTIEVLKSILAEIDGSIPRGLLQCMVERFETEARKQEVYDLNRFERNRSERAQILYKTVRHIKNIISSLTPARVAEKRPSSPISDCVFASAASSNQDINSTNVVLIAKIPDKTAPARVEESAANIGTPTSASPLASPPPSAPPSDKSKRTNSWQDFSEVDPLCALLGESGEKKDITKNGSWTCERCTFDNCKECDLCAMCDAERPKKRLRTFSMQAHLPTLVIDDD